MKVFYALNDPFNEPNPYTYTLIDGIRSQVKDFDYGYGIERFWNDDLSEYDIIHIMFPDVLCYGHSDQELQARLECFKNTGIKVIATCHNLHSHVGSNKYYEIVYTNSNCIIHLGNYSYDLLKTSIQTNHIILPHHVYDNVYKDILSRDVALKKLGLSPNKRYVLSFGAFRKEEERAFVTYVAKALYKQDVCVLAPTFVIKYNRRNPKFWLKPLFHYWKYKIKAPNLISSCCFVSDDLLPYYYAVSDVSFIQRLDILNSGSVPMGMYMGHVIVGPDLGNVGTLLRSNQNPVFNPKDYRSAVEAVEQGLYLYTQGIGDKNREKALEEYNTRVISRRLYENYIKVLHYE